MKDQMTREDIIAMAREAGFTIGPVTREIYSAPGGFYAELERFATLVAAAEREVIACWYEEDGWTLPASEGAAAIRAREQK